jgi:hypothetical protein
MVVSMGTMVFSVSGTTCQLKLKARSQKGRMHFAFLLNGPQYEKMAMAITTVLRLLLPFEAAIEMVI